MVVRSDPGFWKMKMEMGNGIGKDQLFQTLPEEEKKVTLLKSDIFGKAFKTWGIHVFLCSENIGNSSTF